MSPASVDCLHLKSSVWGQSNFPRNSFYRMEGKLRAFDRNISHSKMIIVTQGDEINDDTLIYIGSHNMSANAWGKEEKQAFCVANWELGIVYIPQEGSKECK